LISSFLLLNVVVTGALRLIGNRSPRENGGFVEEYAPS
jgi:hypothetical protein